MARLLSTVAHDASLCALIELGLQHEQQHQELMLTDIQHLLSCNPLFPVYAAACDVVPPPVAATLTWHSLDGGLIEIGHTGEGFAFDNEGPRHRTYLCTLTHWPRALLPRLNLRPLWRAGGYQNPMLWLAEGWDWRAAQGLNHPLYWHRVEGEWYLLHVGSGLQPLEGSTNRWCICRTTRLMPTRAGREPACRPRPNGSTLRRRMPTSWRSFLASPGNGHSRATPRTPAFRWRQVPWANTTASSW